ncbi:hypothetical protein HOK00_01660 [bacterium]|jgi:hypothetical protein|nr:hypothetical protein [bacterium]
MINNIMLSGPDGTGKSTIIDAIKKELANQNIDISIVWLRFHHYSAKIVNIIGRIFGKSYKEKYKWGQVGYHDYSGVFGKVYIFAVYLDHNIFKLFIKNKKLNHDKDYVVDRYILDIVADLIVDTKNEALVFRLFDKDIRDELSQFDTFILECDIDIVISRRDDIKDDKKYTEKINAYKIISEKYNITRINTGENSIDETVQKIIK